MRIGPTPQADGSALVDVDANVGQTTGDTAIAAKVDAGSLLHAAIASDSLVDGAGNEHQAQILAADDLLAATIGAQDIGVPVLGDGVMTSDSCAGSGPVDLSAVDAGAILDAVHLPDCLAA